MTRRCTHLGVGHRKGVLNTRHSSSALEGPCVVRANASQWLSQGPRQAHRLPKPLFN